MDILTTNVFNRLTYVTLGKRFSEHIDGFNDLGVSDFDEIIEGVRLCVDFEIIHLNGLKVKAIDIIDWDNDEPIDDEYSLALRHSIRKKVSEYNNTPLVTEDSLKTEREYRDMIMFDRW